MKPNSKRSLAALMAALSALLLSGCAGHLGERREEKAAFRAQERNCLIRAMYFESDRSSKAGLLAVGTVVMNRVASPIYPHTICGVVGEPHQFAPGVMTRSLDPDEMGLAAETADEVLAGKRSKAVGDAMYFHVAGLKIPYRVHYVAVAGGNAFYEKEPGRGLRGYDGVEMASAATHARSRSASGSARSSRAQPHESVASARKVADKQSAAKIARVAVVKPAPKSALANMSEPGQPSVAPRPVAVMTPPAAPSAKGPLLATAAASPDAAPVSAVAGEAVSVVAKSCGSQARPAGTGLEQAALRCGAASPSTVP